MSKGEEWMIIGEITSPHGIDGKIKVKSFSDFPERFTKPGPRWLQIGNEKPMSYTLLSGRNKPGTDIFIISFKEIDTRNKALDLKNHKLLVRQSDIPSLEPGEFHINQLINLKVKQLGKFILEINLIVVS